MVGSANHFTRHEVRRKLREEGYGDIDEATFEDFYNALNALADEEALAIEQPTATSKGTTKISHRAQRRVEEGNLRTEALKQHEPVLDAHQDFHLGVDFRPPLAPVTGTYHQNGNIPRSSFIIPKPDPGQTRRKSDPISRYQQYQSYWDAMGLNKGRTSSRYSSNYGTSSPNAVWRRTDQRTGLGARPAPRMQVNNYVVPTEKKREKLRWAVREKMLTGQTSGAGAILPK
eukprot:Clim_evm32s211 gene=Clim_evmTU32s211